MQKIIVSLNPRLHQFEFKINKIIRYVFRYSKFANGEAGFCLYERKYKTLFTTPIYLQENLKQSLADSLDYIIKELKTECVFSFNKEHLNGFFVENVLKNEGQQTRPVK